MLLCTDGEMEEWVMTIATDIDLIILHSNHECLRHFSSALV